MKLGLTIALGLAGLALFAVFWCYPGGYTKEMYMRSATVANAHFLTRAFLLYVPDSNGRIPSTLRTAEDLRLMLAPHVDSGVFETHNPNGGEFVPNARIAGKSLADLGPPETVIVLIESRPWPDGKKALGFADGHVRRYDGSVVNASEVEQYGDATVIIGVVDPSRWGHVTNLLERHGIQAIVEGSVVYSVCVPKEDVQQARQLLQDDSQKEGYWFQEKALVLSDSLLTFDECPDPSALENAETRSAATTKYKKCMRKLNDLNSRDLRLLVVEIQNRRTRLLNSDQSNYNDSKQYVDDGDKLFLLNRFVFDVPNRAAAGSPAFWRLTAYHTSPGSVNYLYPLSSEGGRLVFSAETLSYGGTGLDAGDQLDEFDYFAKKFARRNEIR